MKRESVIVSRIVVGLGLLVFCAPALPVRAFDGPEHVAIGAEGARAAFAADGQHGIHLPLRTPADGRWIAVGRRSSDQLPSWTPTDDTSGGDIILWSRDKVDGGSWVGFGELVAMYGDHIGRVHDEDSPFQEDVVFRTMFQLSPAEMRQVRGAVLPGPIKSDCVDIESIADIGPLVTSKCAKLSREYGRLAALNAYHFSAEAVDWYVQYHGFALAEAQKAQAGGDPVRLVRALHYEAFAAHVLTDLFANGHVMTSRELAHPALIFSKTPADADYASRAWTDLLRSLAQLGKAYEGLMFDKKKHDAFNDAGATVRAALDAGFQWRIRGDNGLASLGQGDRARPVDAVRVSLIEVLTTYGRAVAKQSAVAAPFLALDMLPSQYRPDAANPCGAGDAVAGGWCRHRHGEFASYVRTIVGGSKSMPAAKSDETLGVAQFAPGGIAHAQQLTGVRLRFANATAVTPSSVPLDAAAVGTLVRALDDKPVTWNGISLQPTAPVSCLQAAKGDVVTFPLGLVGYVSSTRGTMMHVTTVATWISPPAVTHMVLAKSTPGILCLRASGGGASTPPVTPPVSIPPATTPPVPQEDAPGTHTLAAALGELGAVEDVAGADGFKRGWQRLVDYHRASLGAAASAPLEPDLKKVGKRPTGWYWSGIFATWAARRGGAEATWRVGVGIANLSGTSGSSAARPGFVVLHKDNKYGVLESIGGGNAQVIVGDALGRQTVARATWKASDIVKSYAVP